MATMRLSVLPSADSISASSAAMRSDCARSPSRESISAFLFWMALATTVLAAVMSSMTDGPLMAVLQTTVAPAMQGRVLTLMGSMATAISPLGLAVAGPVADRLGVQIWYIVGGAVCMSMGILAFFIPSILNMEDHRAAPEAGESEVTLTSA